MFKYYKILSNGAFGGEITLDQDFAPPDYTALEPGHPKFDKVFKDGGWITPETSVIDPTEWFIDIGPFFDRFGALKLAVLTSTDAGIKAIIQDVSIRKWIDLKRADVAQSLAYIGSVIPAFNLAAQQAIVTTPVLAAENLALKRLYFS